MHGWCVYILRCGDGTLYTGIAADLERRLAAHRSGNGARYTSSRLPLRVVYSESMPDRPHASRREAAIKKLPRREKLVLIRQARKKTAKRRPPGRSAPPSPPAP